MAVLSVLSIIKGYCWNMVISNGAGLLTGGMC